MVTFPFWPPMITALGGRLLRDRVSPHSPVYRILPLKRIAATTGEYGREVKKIFFFKL